MVKAPRRGHRNGAQVGRGRVSSSLRHTSAMKTTSATWTPRLPSVDGVNRASDATIKISGVTPEIIKGTLHQGKRRAGFILKKILHSAIQTPRGSISTHAPRITTHLRQSGEDKDVTGSQAGKNIAGIVGRDRRRDRHRPLPGSEYRLRQRRSQSVVQMVKRLMQERRNRQASPARSRR